MMCFSSKRSVHIEEQRFAKRVAAVMEQVVRARDVPALVVVVPPKTLADLRRAFHVDVREDPPNRLWEGV